MNRQNVFAPLCLAGVGIAAVIGSFALAQPDKNSKPGAQPEFKLPPGWTTEDMQACVLAGTPGEMHKLLAKSAGTWNGKCTMWMGPGTDPMPTSDCTFTFTPIMDGHYLKAEMVGDMPGMGPMNGFSIYGYDNVSHKFVANWIDNHSTGIMNGTGDLSPDGKTLTWNYTANCPITRKPIVMRQIERITSDTTKKLEMFTTDPKSGKEYKMMVIDFTKKS